MRQAAVHLFSNADPTLCGLQIHLCRWRETLPSTTWARACPCGLGPVTVPSASQPSSGCAMLTRQHTTHGACNHTTHRTHVCHMYGSVPLALCACRVHSKIMAASAWNFSFNSTVNRGFLYLLGVCVVFASSWPRLEPSVC